MMSNINRQELLTILWLLISLFLFGYFISAITAAGNVREICSQVNEESQVDHNWAFMMIWHLLVAVFLWVAGTMVMKRHRTPLAVGVFMGATFIMSFWTLGIAVGAGGQIGRKSLIESVCKKSYSSGADSAVVFFAVFLFLLYGAFAYLLAKSRDELFGDDPLMSTSGNSYPQGTFENVNTNDSAAVV